MIKMTSIQEIEVMCEKQHYEPTKAYEAFVCYLRMGRKRSYAKVAKELGKRKSLIAKWGMLYDWQIRARWYEDSLINEAMRQHHEHILSVNAEYRRIATYLRTKAMKMLETSDTAKLSAKDAVLLLDTSVKLEQIASDAIEEEMPKGHDHDCGCSICHPIPKDITKEMLFEVARETWGRIQEKLKENEAKAKEAEAHASLQKFFEHLKEISDNCDKGTTEAPVETANNDRDHLLNSPRNDNAIA